MQTYRHILFATNLSPMTEAAVLRVAALTRGFRAQLTVLHVIEHFSVDAPNDPIPPENVDSATFLEADARNRLEHLVRQIGRRRARLMVSLSTGSATHVIVEVARNIRADLIVLASGGHEHALHLLRSTPCAVLNDAPCDVLVLQLADISVAPIRVAQKRRSRSARSRRH